MINNLTYFFRPFISKILCTFTTFYMQTVKNEWISVHLEDDDKNDPLSFKNHWGKMKKRIFLRVRVSGVARITPQWYNLRRGNAHTRYNNTNNGHMEENANQKQVNNGLFNVSVSFVCVSMSLFCLFRLSDPFIVLINDDLFVYLSSVQQRELGQNNNQRSKKSLVFYLAK